MHSGWSLGAPRVAERLGFRFVDDEIIREAARLSGEPADLIADAERRKGFLERALSSMATSGAGMAYAASVERFNPPRNAEALIREAISAIAAQGSVVIGAHAAAMQLGCALARLGDPLHRRVGSCGSCFGCCWRRRSHEYARRRRACLGFEPRTDGLKVRCSAPRGGSVP